MTATERTTIANGVAAATDPLQRLNDLIVRLSRAARSEPGGELTAVRDELLDIATDLRPLERAAEQSEQLEQAIRTAQEVRLRYQELFDFSLDGFIVTDRLGQIVEANHEASALLNTPKEFLIGKPLACFIAGGWRSAVYDYLTRLQRGGGAEEWQTLVQPRRRRPRHAILTVSAIPTDRGGPPCYRWKLRDLTAQKQLERTLRAERTLVDSIVEAVEAAVLILDDAGRITRTNPFLERLCGLPQGELFGRIWWEVLLSEADRPRGRALFRRAQRPGVVPGGTTHAPADTVLSLLTHTGIARTVTWTAWKLPVEVGEARLVMLGFDITDLQLAQQRALQSERLAAVGQMVAGLAHETRNALQRSQSCLSLLEFRLEGQTENLDLLRRVQKAQNDLTRLFEDVRLYSAPVQIEADACNLADVWREAWADLGLTTAGARLREEVAGVDLRCRASAFRLKQVFRNLFDNALGAVTGPAVVTVAAAAADLDGRPGIRIAVSDNGPGFVAEQRQKAFEPFYTTKVRGTGLGLPICRRIIEAHGGRMELGEGGQGAEVVITLPRRTS